MPVKFDRSLLPAAPDLAFEKALWSGDLQWIAGVDEAGRGALAGPVFAAAVILPPHLSTTEAFNGVRDSKAMTPAQRQDWAARLRTMVYGWGIGLASAQEIDTLGIIPATCLAAWRAIEALPVPPQHLLLDYLELPDCPFPQTPVVKGDARSLSLAAASVLAKSARDAHMVELDRCYPGYGFAVHKGYGTAAHLAALTRLGPSPIHRRSFRPVSQAAGEEVESTAAQEN